MAGRQTDIDILSERPFDELRTYSSARTKAVIASREKSQGDKTEDNAGRSSGIIDKMLGGGKYDKLF